MLCGVALVDGAADVAGGVVRSERREDLYPGAGAPREGDPCSNNGGRARFARLTLGRDDAAVAC